ncbi:MAG: response regulator, partial [Candidatus Brocadiaceae bacterium]|nr:response regulator [Candidatus Brocadiaceae bacterium]
KKQLLLVEDDMFSAETLKYALEAKGHEVIMATNGSDALSIVRKKNPQLVVLDIMMPKMDGYHLCRFIKFDTRYKHIPVIFVSSKIQEADKKLGFTCGGDEYVTKPYDIDNLVNLVDRYLESIQRDAMLAQNAEGTSQGGTPPMPNQGNASQGGTPLQPNQGDASQGGTPLQPNQGDAPQGGKIQTMMTGETFVIRDNAKITVLNIDREKIQLGFNDSDPVTIYVHECKTINEDISVKNIKTDMDLVELEITVSDKTERSKKWFY